MSNNQDKKHNISPVKQKILQYVELLGVTKYVFYQKTGITRGMLDAKSGVSEENIAKFLRAYPDVSANWLFDQGDIMERQDIPPNHEHIYMLNEQDISYGKCNTCIEKDKVILSQQKTIETQDKLIQALEVNKTK